MDLVIFMLETFLEEKWKCLCGGESDEHVDFSYLHWDGIKTRKKSHIVVELVERRGFNSKRRGNGWRDREKSKCFFTVTAQETVFARMFL